MRRQELMKGKTEAGHAGRDSRREKQCRPPIESSAGEPPGCENESRGDADDAQDHVEGRVRFKAEDHVGDYTAPGAEAARVTARAARRIESADRSTSSSVVDQFDTEIRIASMPCQRVAPSQQTRSS